MFAYQTFDGCDGKHARNTKSSSIVGELFDHGCDAVSNIWIHTVLVHCLGFGLGKEVYCALFGACVTFMMFAFEKKFTGKLRTGLKHFGIIEGHFLAMTILVLTGVYSN